MKTLTHILALVFFWSLASISLAAVKTGTAAPDFSLQDSQGNTVKLADFKGRYVVLEWTNHLCPFVGKHYDSGNMQSLQKTYTDKGYIWLSIISSAPGKQGHVSPQKANQLTQDRNAHPSAVLLDETGTAGKTYGAKTTPHMFIIDPDGTLVYMGGIDSIASADKGDLAQAENFVRAAFDDLEAGKSVQPPINPPYGCSVKY